MNSLSYDEQSLRDRLAVLDRRSKTAFAASCAQRLRPLFERYARVVGKPELGVRLGLVVAAAWDVAGGADVDMRPFQEEAEGLVPSDNDGWLVETGCAQNAATAAAYAVRAWLTNDPQEAAWAGRQVYELADYAVLQSMPDLDLNAVGASALVEASAMVQLALAALERALRGVESGPSTWDQLRAEAASDGDKWLAVIAPNVEDRSG